MSNQFVGEIRCVAFNFPPLGWQFCDGQLLAISQNTALFSLLGTYYGGDGKSTFGLPNMQGNVSIGFGNGPGLTPRNLGETGGVANVTLLSGEMPRHTHTYMTDLGDAPADTQTPSAATSLSTGQGTNVYTTATSPAVAMASSALSIVGSGQPHNNMMQYLVLNFIIAMQGVFPTRG
jgi:microcystin-dependent protein